MIMTFFTFEFIPVKKKKYYEDNTKKYAFHVILILVNNNRLEALEEKVWRPRFLSLLCH